MGLTPDLWSLSFLWGDNLKALVFVDRTKDRFPWFTEGWKLIFKQSLPLQPLVLAAAILAEVFFTACSSIPAHSPVPTCSRGLAGFLGRVVWSPATKAQCTARACCWQRGQGNIMPLLPWSGAPKLPPTAVPGMCIHPCHRTSVSSCFKISLRTGWALSNPRRICLDELFLQWGSCSIMFQLKFGALICPGMKIKRTHGEGLGEVDNFTEGTG